MKLKPLLLLFIVLSSPFMIMAGYPPPIEAQEVPDGVNWVLLGDEPRRDTKRFVEINYIDFKLNVSYGQYFIVFEPYVIFNGNLFTLEQVINIYPDVLQRIDVIPLPLSWKYQLVINNIPDNLAQGVEAIGFARFDSNLGLDDVRVGNDEVCWGETVETYQCVQTKHLVVKDKVVLRYDDLLPKFMVDVTWTDIRITNITSNIVNGDLTLDPSIVLQDAGTENLADAYVWSNNNATNYGGAIRLNWQNETIPASDVRRSYIRFNLSQVINAAGFSAITDATLYLYYDSNSPHAGNMNITTHFVNNTVWGEASITFTNQPCGATKYSVNANCNATASDSSVFVNGVNGWHNWNVTSIVQDYNASDLYTSIGVFADVGAIPSNLVDVNMRAWSKEGANVALRPILNVTYSIAGNTAPLNINVTISNMDDTNYTYAMARNYTYLCVWNDTDGVDDLDFGMFAFTDGTNWVNITVDIQSMAVTITLGAAVVFVQTPATNVTSGNRVYVTVSLALDWDIVDASAVEIYQWCNDTAGDEDGWDEVRTNYFNIESDLESSNFVFVPPWGFPSSTGLANDTLYYEGSSTTQPQDGYFVDGCIIRNSSATVESTANLTSAVCEGSFTMPATVGAHVYDLYINGSGDYSDGVLNSTTFYISPVSFRGMEITLIILFTAIMLIFFVLSWLPFDSLGAANITVFSVIAMGVGFVLALLVPNTELVRSSGQGFFISTTLTDAYTFTWFYLMFGLISFLRFVWGTYEMIMRFRGSTEAEADRELASV